MLQLTSFTATELSAWCCTVRARGEATEESDYDIAVFLRDMPERCQEMKLLADISKEILHDTGELIQAMAYYAEAYRARSPLMGEIRRDGIGL